MKKEIPILIATKDTPELTCHALSTCFQYNPNNNLLFLVGSSVGSELKKIKKVTDLIDNIKVELYHMEESVFYHGEIISYIYEKRVKDNFENFILMDNDVYFTDYHRIDDMLPGLQEENVFCVTDEFKENNYIYCPPNVYSNHFANGTVVTGAWSFQSRIEPYLSLWKNDYTFKKAFSLFNFNVVLQQQDANTNKFYDTTSALSNLMLLLGKKVFIIKSNKHVHMRGKTTTTIHSYEKTMIENGLKKIIKFS